MLELLLTRGAFILCVCAVVCVRAPLPGQDVGLFGSFRGLTVHLWHLWELAIRGEPVLVVAPTPAEASNAVLAIVSLVAPLPYAGEYRPYFTLYDRDCNEARVRVCVCVCVCVCACLRE